MSTESKYFCPLPWVHFYTEPNGTVSLCCVANPPLKGEDGRPLSIQRQAPRALWNTQAFREARRQMATGEPSPFCTYCYKNEENGVPSYRQFVVGEYKTVQGKPIAQVVAESEAKGWTADDPVYVDLRLGNLCNLNAACAIRISARRSSATPCMPSGGAAIAIRGCSICRTASTTIWSIGARACS
ncbi:MAG: SPASM domain-containing protein [Aliidongia sp.]